MTIRWGALSSARPIRYADPLQAGRHPYQTMMLLLCIVSGFPLMVGWVDNTTTQVAPHPVVLYWGVSLFLGALVGLAGSYWPMTRYATGVTVETIGIVVIVPAAIAYAVTIFLVSGWDGAVSGCLILGFGLASLVRARDLFHVLHRARLKSEGDPLPLPDTEPGR